MALGGRSAVAVAVQGPKEHPAFRAFFEDAEPRLRRALVAAYGTERGREAAAEALAWAWEHWAEVEQMDNPVGYLYRVGQSRTRPPKRRPVYEIPVRHDIVVEPGLGDALAELSERQRVAVVLVHGFGLTHREVAQLTGIATSSVQNHLERGLRRLRRSLEVRIDG